MNTYYLNINQQDNSGYNYEVHKELCRYCFPYRSNFIKLGSFVYESNAILKAKNSFPYMASKIDGCKHCCHSINND
ncbi:MAG: hypothetical protein IJ105_03020 [Bacilli bacterium]|nr:hypothetical protein [Bacilli bacterium]